MKLFLYVSSFHFLTQDRNCVSSLGQIFFFLHQELLFQLSYHVVHKLIVPRERSSSSTCTYWMKFDGCMYKELSILLGLSPRSFAASDTAFFPNRGEPSMSGQGFVHFVETMIVEWFQVWQVFFTYPTKRVCIHLDADFVFHCRMKKHRGKHRGTQLFCGLPSAARFAAKAKTKMNDTGVVLVLAKKSLFSSFHVLTCFITSLALTPSLCSFSTQRVFMTSFCATSELGTPCVLMKAFCD